MFSFCLHKKTFRNYFLLFGIGLTFACTLKSQVELLETYSQVGIKLPVGKGHVVLVVEAMRPSLIEYYRDSNHQDSISNHIYFITDSAKGSLDSLGVARDSGRYFYYNLKYLTNHSQGLLLRSPHGMSIGTLETLILDSIFIPYRFLLADAAFYSSIALTNSVFGDKNPYGYIVFSAYFGGGIRFDHCTFNNRTLLFQTNCDSMPLWFTNCSFTDRIRLSNISTTMGAHFLECTFKDTLDLSTIVSDHAISISKCRLKVIRLKDIRLQIRPYHLFLENLSSFDNGPIYLNIDNTSIDNLIITNSNIELVFDNSTTNKAIDAIYERLLYHLQETGQYDQYEHFDKKYKSLKYSRGDIIDRFFGLIDHYAWDYGYDRNRIIVWTGGLLLGFSLLFWSFQPYFFYNVYSIGDLNEALQQRQNKKRRNCIGREFLNLQYSIFYTSYIFFGLKIDLFQLKHARLFPALIVLMCYVIGLLCLAFIARLIFGF